jgi:regulator of RNase E activity RraA
MNDQDLLQRCRAISTSTWSDALDAFAIDGVVRGLSQRSGHGRIAGLALTVRESSGPLQCYAPQDFSIGDAIEKVAPGQMLLIDSGGAEVSTCGGLAALAAQLRGAEAVIIDGACRDLDEIRRLGLWVASRSVTPVTGKTRIKVEAINEPVRIGGVIVRPGDLVVADETGLVVIPAQKLADVLARAEALLEIDARLEAALKAGKSFSKAAADTHYIRPSP